MSGFPSKADQEKILKALDGLPADKMPPLPEDDDRKPSAQPKFSQQDIGDGPESAQPLQQIESTEDARDAVFIELLDVAKEIRDLLKDAFEGTE